MSTSPASSSASKPESHLESQNEDDSNRYSRFSIWRKRLVLFIVSWSAFAVISSSTSLLTAAPEIAAEFGTTVEIINITNAAVLVVMGSSSLFWGPLSKYFWLYQEPLLTILSWGNWSSTCLQCFYPTHILMLYRNCIGAEYASFHSYEDSRRMFRNVHSACGPDHSVWHFRARELHDFAAIHWSTKWCLQTVRGTAIGFFMIGTVTAPAIGIVTASRLHLTLLTHLTGPLLGGIITNFTSWRMIYVSNFLYPMSPFWVFEKTFLDLWFSPMNNFINKFILICYSGYK